MLDDLEAKPEAIRTSLDFMTWVNRTLGGVRVILEYLEECRVPDEFSVLDIGSGAGDIPHAMVQWAKRNGKKISVTAIDLNAHCVAHAKARFPDPEISFLRHSAFEMESLGNFDYITSSMFFHHLTDDRIVGLLNLMKRRCRKGFIVSDLYRNVWNYLGAFVLGALSFRRIVFNDAKLSVKRAFREQDLARYRRQSGLSELKIERKPVFRITLGYHD
jgi:2-polyprenyl-3-methyl-5-hydroxy-6-metoxy-1,4-benzoquinol methylase